MSQEFQSLCVSLGLLLEACSRATSRLGSGLQEALVVLWRLVWTLIATVDWRLGRKTGCLEKRTRKRTSSTNISAGDARTMSGFSAIAYGNAHCARSRPGGRDIGIACGYKG